MVATNHSPHTSVQPPLIGGNVNTEIPPTLPLQSSHVIQPLPAVIRGRSDWREYRPFQLENGIQCMLVHDKESKFTAMSVAVNVGASSDPRSFSGLAHFTEHMCFLGSEKYPGENEYKKYLSSHGGRSNASTSMSFTTFKFDVLAEHAEPAVDIFTQFFVAPLFTESGTSREVQAVDSENTRNIADDGRRRLQVLKALANPQHHFSKFSTGNKETLSGTHDSVNGLHRMRKAVLAFHRKHYTPENMVCVIVGPQSLDQLQEWIVPRLASIQRKQNKTSTASFDQPVSQQQDQQQQKEMSLSERDSFAEDLEIENIIQNAAVDAPPTRYMDPAPTYNPAFSPENQGGKWPLIITLDPLKLQRKVVLLFPLPSVYKSPDTSPVAYISHLLGYEGVGSPFAVLQDAGLVNFISTGSRINAPDQCLFQVDISLTEKGEDEWKDVVQVIFEYIRLIQKAAEYALSECGSSETCGSMLSAKEDVLSQKSELHRIWDEMASIKAMNFNFTAPGSAYDFAPDLAQSIMSHGTKYCLTGGRRLVEEPYESKPSLPLQGIHDFSMKMSPENCIIERFSKRAWEESIMLSSKAQTIESKNGVNGGTIIDYLGLKQEKWYGVNYTVSSVDEVDVNRWKKRRTGSIVNTDTKDAREIKEMQLPKPNQFLPRSFELSSDLPEEAKHGPRIDKEMDPPKLLSTYYNSKRLWHRLDDRYALPKSSFVILLRNPCVEHIYDKKSDTWMYDEHSALCTSLLMNMFSDGLAQATYDASVAGLSWSATKSASGISIACIGYSDRLPELSTLLTQAFCDKFAGVDGSDKSSIFLTETYFSAAKDRMKRSLQSYFQSGRADSHAFYYRDFVLTGRGRGVDHKLELLDTISLIDIAQQQDRILQYAGTEYDCLYSGNVAEEDSKSLFQKICDILDSMSPQRDSDMIQPRWIPGPVARKLPSGDEIELHFSSRNPEEQSGAVVMTFQSSKASFKGAFLSPTDILKDTAAVRLICHLLREPFFNELRTKQQLGYVVQSSYEIAFSSSWPDSNSLEDDTSSSMHSYREITPIDSIVMSILSKNTSPLDVAERIDNFLSEFRHSLENMPLSEIKDHAASLSKQLQKPIQNLGDEVAIQFSKIQLYAPEILSKGGSPMDMPWNNAKILSDEIVRLDRSDLLKAWDTLVSSSKRSRITSFVYGKAFPFTEMANGVDLVKPSFTARKHKILHYTLDELLHRRLQLGSFAGSVVNRPNSTPVFSGTTFKRGMIGLTALAVISASILKFVAARSDDKERGPPSK